MRPVLLTLLLLTGCSGESAPVPDRVTGTVSEVRPASGPVDSFTIDTEFETYEVLLDPERDYGFPPRHLEVHRETGQRVVVWLEDRDGEAVAVRIEDV